MTDTDWNGLSEAFAGRLAVVAELPFQVRDQPHRRVRDELTGRHGLVNPARASRLRRPDRACAQDACPYCEGRTPPTLFYVPGRQPRTPYSPEQQPSVPGRDSQVPDGSPVWDRTVVCRPPPPIIEDETVTLDLAREVVASGSEDTWSLLDRLGQSERLDHHGRPGPAVFPREPWLTRVFPNATPLVVDPLSAANGFVIGVPPPWHDADLVCCADEAARPAEPAAGRKGEAVQLPQPVMTAVVASWALLETWAEARGLAAVPFVNGGKNPASGQSLPCFHGQFYALGPSDTPPLYELIARRRSRGCPVCAVVRDPGLHIATVGAIRVAAHPAPELEATLLVAPDGDVRSLRHLPSLEEMASALLVAGRCLSLLLGGSPAYNLVIRTGNTVGHLHAEIVPRTRIGMRAGFEMATGYSVLAKDPVAVAAECRRFAESVAFTAG